MYPNLFGIEFLDMYSILLIIGLFTAVLLFKFICGKKKVDDKTYNFFAMLGVISIVLGLVFAFLFQSMYNYIDDVIQKGFALAKFELRGMTFMGGLVGGVVTFLLGTLLIAKPEVKQNFWKIANYAAPCIVVGHMFGRLGCFCAPCCYGIKTDSFLGVKFPHMNYKVYPTQLFEALFLAVLLTVMLILLFKYKKENFLILLYGFGYAVFRFMIEFIRGDERGSFLPGLTPSQWQSIILLIATIAVTILVYKFNIIPFSKAKARVTEKLNDISTEDVLPIDVLPEDDKKNNNE